MARTAPVPNIPAIPGMNPGIFVMGGGGGGGGAGGKGGKGKGKTQAAGGQTGGDGASGGGGGSGSCGPGAGGGCMNPAHGNAGTHAGDPVDVATGRVYTLPQTDLALSGPLVFAIERSYSSFSTDNDVGLGPGWSHSLAWSIEVRRRVAIIHRPHTAPIRCALPKAGEHRDLPARGRLWRAQRAFLIGDGDLFYHFEASPLSPRLFRLSSVGDRAGNELRLEYDPRGLLVGLRDSLGRPVRVVRDGSGRILRFELRTHRDRTVSYRHYRYDQRGDLVEVVDALGRRTHLGYDDNHRLTRLTHPSLLTIYYRYDALGRAIETWCERPGDTSLASSIAEVLADGTPARGLLHAKIEREEDSVTVIDSRQVRRFDLSESGHIELAAGVWVEQRTYDDKGNVRSYSAPNQAVTTFEYDDDQRMTTAVGPLGERREYQYAPEGQIVEALDALGYALQYHWDDAGNLLDVSDAVGMLIRFGYDERGLRTMAELPSGARTEMAYDGEANLVRILEPSGKARELAYDDEGRLTGVVDEAGLTTRYHHDAMGALVRVELSSGRIVHFAYDSDGRLARYVDPNGASFELVWGGIGVVTEIRKPTGEKLSLRYDREQNLVEAHNELGEVHQIDRDLAGRVIAERTFDGRIHRYRLDAAGQMVRFEDHDGGLTEIERDANGRVVKRLYPDDAFDAFEYDAEGRLMHSETESSIVRYEYDARGNLTREIQEVGGEPIIVETQYDESGRLILRSSSVTPPQRIGRDRMGRATEIEIGGRSIRRTFDAVGRELLCELPDGGRILSRHKGLYGLAERRLSNGVSEASGPEWVGDLEPGTTYAEWFERNEAGQLLEHVVAGGERRRLSLDPLGRVTEITVDQQPVESFSYEGAGRHYEALPHAPTRHYEAGGRLARWSDRAFEYDGEARRMTERDMSGGGIVRHRYDGRGLLVESHLPDGRAVAHVYDGEARRLQKIVSHPDGRVLVTRFAWSGDDLIFERTTELGAGDATVVSRRSYYHDDEGGYPLAHIDHAAEGDRCLYYILGEEAFPSLLVDAKANVVGRLTPSLWGMAEGEAARLTPFRFHGQYADSETGLYYNRHRFYDPRVGHFISADPIGLEGGWNPFEYAKSAPWSAADPDGLQPEPVTATVRGGGVTGRAGSAQTRTSTDLHPIVEQAMPPGIQTGAGSIYPAGERHPSTCAEPSAISDYIRRWEKKHNSGQPLDPNNPRDRKKIERCLGNIKEISAAQEGRGNRAPCPNCTQLLSNLSQRWGAPKQRTVTPGLVTDAPVGSGNVARGEPPDRRWADGMRTGAPRTR